MTALAEAPSRRTSPMAVSAIAELNENHAVILLGEKPAVLREEVDVEGRRNIRILSVSGFEQWMRPRLVRIGKRLVPLASVWLDSPERRA